eukprot:GFKZ01002642.1.p1 GENE.GFKZ01002642.1~~GFKZ01002642.1.p1  ORF type:complete len:119 (+),score=7.14 GFKZ01002642.1:147-503(+)
MNTIFLDEEARLLSEKHEASYNTRRAAWMGLKSSQDDILYNETQTVSCRGQSEVHWRHTSRQIPLRWILVPLALDSLGTPSWTMFKAANEYAKAATIRGGCSTGKMKPRLDQKLSYAM